MKTYTASEARQMRKEIANRDKPKKARAKIQKSEHEKLMDRADAWFSKWFRANEANENGAVRCATCGKWMLWRMPDGSCHTSHFQSRWYQATRFNPKNVAIGCRKCNYFLEGNKIKLREYLVGRYGEGEVQRVEVLAQTGCQRSAVELAGIADYFKKEFRKIEKQKGL